MSTRCEQSRLKKCHGSSRVVIKHTKRIGGGATKERVVDPMIINSLPSNLLKDTFSVAKVLMQSCSGKSFVVNVSDCLKVCRIS